MRHDRWKNLREESCFSEVFVGACGTFMYRKSQMWFSLQPWTRRAINNIFKSAENIDICLCFYHNSLLTVCLVNFEKFPIGFKGPCRKFGVWYRFGVIYSIHIFTIKETAPSPLDSFRNKYLKYLLLGREFHKSFLGWSANSPKPGSLLFMYKFVIIIPGR